MIWTLSSVALTLLLVLLVRRPFARTFGAKAAYALWLVPFFRLIAPPLPTWLSPWRAAPAAESAAPATQILETQALPVSREGWTAPIPLDAELIETAPAVSTGWSLPELSVIAEGFSLIALLGAGAVIAVQAWRQARFAMLVRAEAEPVSAALLSQMSSIAREIGLKRTPRLCQSLLCSGPLVTGFLRPTILVPAWFEADYTPSERRIALLHEAMHIRRGDLIALQAAHLVAALQWFNPLTGRAMKAFRADQEAACDADILRAGMASPRAYGATLLKAIRQSRSRAAPAFVAGLPLNHAIKERFEMLAAPAPRRHKVALGVTAASALALVFLTAAPTAAQEDDLAGGNEPETRASRHIIVNSDMIDRQLVLLTNPMEGLDDHLGRIDNIEIPVPPLPPVPPVPGLDADAREALAEISRLSAELSAAVSQPGAHHIRREDGTEIVIVDGEEICIDEIEARIEALASEIEASGTHIEISMERWEEEFEVEMEAFEREMERVEVEIERLTEGPEFERIVERGAASIRELSAACQDADFTSGPVQVFTSEAGDRAVCVEGERALLTSEEINDAVLAHPELSEEERERFLAERSHRFTWEYRED